MPLFTSVGTVSSYTRRAGGRFAGGGYSPVNAEATTLFAAMTTQPSDVRKALIDQLISDLKTAGVWTKLNIFYVMAAHDEQAGRLNWVNPSTFTLTESGTTTFTADRGEAGNGTNGYLSTNWDPATNGAGLYTQNAAHLGLFVQVSTTGSNNLSRATASVPNLMNIGTGGLFRINGTAGSVATSWPPGSVPGHYVVTRSNTNVNVYRNGYILGSASGASSALDSEDLFIGRSVSSYSADRHSVMHAGGLLTALEVDQMYVAINDYLVAVGAYDSYMSGGWSWFSTRRALLTSGGDLWAGVTTPKGEFAFVKEGRAPRVIKPPVAIDDHQNPIIHKRASDGRLITHYRPHTAADFYQRISTNVDDPTEWGAETNLDASFGSTGYSYANLIEITDGLFEIHRQDPGAGRTWYYSVSTDNGATWASPTQLIDGTNPYLRVVKSGANRFDVAVSSAAPELGGNTLKHFYYDAGVWRTSAGVDMGSPPHAIATDPTLIYNTNESWIWDIAFNSVPIVVFSDYPTVSDIRYRYGKWNGSSWDTYEICTMGGAGLYAGQPFYAGGICIDTDNPNVIYCSRRDGGGVFQIWKGVTADGGATWTLTQLTSEASDWCIRPNKEAGSSVVQFMKGTYTAIANFSTVIASVAA